MNNTINGRTPEEIKKGLECRARWGTAECKQKCSECDTYVPGFTGTAAKEALAYIQQLERERDAAVQDISIGRCCATCKDDDAFSCIHCNEMVEFENWQWRGAQEEI